MVQRLPFVPHPVALQFMVAKDAEGRHVQVAKPGQEIHKRSVFDVPVVAEVPQADHEVVVLGYLEDPCAVVGHLAVVSSDVGVSEHEEGDLILFAAPCSPII